MFQTKEQDKILEKDINEMKVSTLPDKEFRGTHQTQEENGWTSWDLQQRDRKCKKVLNTSYRVEEYNTVTELKNTLQGLNRRLDEAEE